MIDFDFSALTDAEARTAYAQATALEKRAHELKEALAARMFDRMDTREDEHAMIGDTIIASLKKINGGTTVTYRVKDPVRYAAWLDRVDAELDGRRATTQVRYPKDECTEQDYLRMIVHQNDGQLPPGIAEVKPRAGSIRVTFAPGIADRLFSGDLTPAFTQLLLEGHADND